VSAAGAEPRQPRLNPFVFPSDTTFRFALLLVAVLGANLYVWNWLWIALGSDQSEVVLEYRGCTDQHQAALSSAFDVDSFTAANDAFSACIREVHLPLAWWMLGGTGLLIAVAAAIMLILPHWIVRRRRLRPLTREEAPAVMDDLAALAREAELPEEPRWLWNPLDPSPTGLAFGRPGSHAVALMGGLVTRQIADPPAFRSVVRHELAHLRNRDVDLTYATVSLWYAFLLAGVLPFAIVVADEGASTVLALGWRLLALAGLVYLTRNAVLRAREVYADVRASVPDGPQGALRRILAGLPKRHASPWGRLRSVHPDPTTRLAAVNDTRRLFPLGLLVAFGAGVAATIAYESLVTFIGIFVDDPLTMRLLAAVAFAPLAMGVVGVGVWRGAWGALADDRARPSTWPLALALAAGFLVGPELALERGVRLDGDSTLLETALGSGAPWIAAVVAGLVLLLAWVGAGAAEWIRALAGSARPGLATAAGLVVASGLLAAFVGIFYTARDTRSLIGFSRSATELEHAQVAEIAWVGPSWLYQLLRDPQILFVLTQPVVFLALVALWLFPLAAWLRRRKRINDAPWAFLEPGGRLRMPLLGRPSLEPWAVGLVFGVAALAALLVLRLALRPSFEAETRARLEFLFAFFYWQFVLALAVQVAAAVVVVARVQREMPLVGALAAAFTAGAIATAGIVVGPSAAGCVDAIAMNPGPCAWDVDAGFTWFVLRQVVAEGALAALAGGLVVLGVQAVLHRRRVPAPPTPADHAR
jgi:Zn-dependent protease with chaperone function